MFVKRRLQHLPHRGFVTNHPRAGRGIDKAFWRVQHRVGEKAVQPQAGLGAGPGERDNGRSAKVPIGIFCSEDQQYIRSWALVSAFTSKHQFKISADKKDERNEEAGRLLTASNVGLSVKVEDTHFEILLDNKSTSVLGNLRVEYCIFYEQDHPDGEEKGVLCGKVEIDKLYPKSVKTLRTETVSTYKSDLKSGYEYRSGAGSLHQGDVDGIWIRVYMSDADGKQSVREYSYPEDLSDKRQWTTTSVDAGINKTSTSRR